MNGKRLLIPLAACLVVAALLLGVSAALRPVAQSNEEQALEALMEQLLPGAGPFTPEEYTGDDGNIRAVYRGSGGYVVRAASYGYVGEVTVLVGVWNDGTISGLVVEDLSETYGLGSRATSDMAFLSQMVGTKGDLAIKSAPAAEDGADTETAATSEATTVVTEDTSEIDGMSGATVTSKAVVRAVNSAVAFVTGADIESSATEWEG